MNTIFSEKAWATVWQYRATFLNGLLNTLESAVVGLAIAMIIGFALGLMAASGKRALRVIARIYVEFFQNTPLILQVCFPLLCVGVFGRQNLGGGRRIYRAGILPWSLCGGSCPRGDTGCALWAV
ncbi:MAG: ABC transporter permease subunit [Christensenellales bacterium]